LLQLVPTEHQVTAPPASPGCFAVSDDGFVNVRQWPNGPIIGPVPVGTKFRVISTSHDDASRLDWSRVQTPWLEQRGMSGVVASHLVSCNNNEDPKRDPPQSSMPESKSLFCFKTGKMVTPSEAKNCS
jgi:hypothetical protein